METKSIYLTHNELCEMFEIPEDSAILTDEYALTFYVPARAWQLSIKVGTKEEVDAELYH